MIQYDINDDEYDGIFGEDDTEFLPTIKAKIKCAYDD